jgi:hypothetical protein
MIEGPPFTKKEEDKNRTEAPLGLIFENMAEWSLVSFFSLSLKLFYTKIMICEDPMV